MINSAFNHTVGIMHFLTLTFLASLIIALHGMVTFNTNEAVMGPSYRLISTDRASCAECGTIQSIPTTQKVTTGKFRNQYRAVQSANSHDGYYMTRWDPLTTQWKIDFISGPLSEDESFAAGEPG